MRFALAIGIILLAAGPFAGVHASQESGGRDRLIVPPYLDVMVLDVFSASADAPVEIFPPGSTTPLRSGIDGVEALEISRGMSTFTVPRPRPGVWRVRKSRTDGRVRIVSQVFFPRGMLVEPSFHRKPVQHDRLSLVYRLLDSDGKALIEPPGYALSLSLSLVKPDGHADALLMTRDGGAEFRSSGIDLSLPGHYWTDVRVMTLDAEKRPLEVLRDRWSGFTVDTRTNDKTREEVPGSRWLDVRVRISIFILVLLAVITFGVRYRKLRA